MSFLSTLKPTFWDHEDITAGPYKHLFNFRRMWKMAAAATAGVTLIPLIFMAVIDYNVHQQAIEAELSYQTAQLVSNTRRSISFFLSERQSVLNFIDKDNTYSNLGNPLRLAALLENLKKGFGGFVDIGVIDATGIQRAYVGPYNLAGNNYSDQEWFKELRSSGAHTSEVFMGFSQQPHLVVAVKYALPQGGFYVLRATIDTQRFNNLLSEVEVSGRGDLFLVNQNGALQTPSRFFGSALERIPISVPEFSERTAVLESVWQNEPLLIGYAYIRDTPFILMAVKKKTELMKPWSETRRKLLLFLIMSITIILVVILGVSTYLVNQIYEADHKRVMTLHQVEYANKMASLGRLSAGVAHEINNPLAIINEKAGLIKDLFTLRREYAEDPKLLSLIDSILYSVERCAKITKRFLNFARHIAVSHQLLDLKEVLDEVIGFLGKEAEFRSIAISVNIDSDVPKIESGRGRLQEVFLNLINNAMAALSDGGRLDITAKRADDHSVAITVTDNGCGIPQADIKRIFEPFFSTKAQSGGTGLGLSITYSLVQEIGGSISVLSEVGKGTEFTIRLPVKMKQSRNMNHESSAGG
jgi:signal transduction histidine kinase